MKLLIALAAATTLLLEPACSDSLPPYPEAVFVVDTDLAVPRFVDSLRVDTFAADGTWIDSHDFHVINARDWPVSFGVYSENLSAPTTVIVRLRAYTSTRLRDYRGERYADASGTVPGPVPAALAAQLPRLIVNGADATPTSEPDPTTTVDRIVQVTLQPNEVGGVNVVMRGDCVGTMASLSAAGSYHDLVPGEAATCIDRPNEQAFLAPATFAPKSTAPTLAGTWNPVTPCNGTAAPATTCVPGGASFLGSSDSAGWDIPAIPQRIVALSPFFIDTNEVSVAQWRAAVQKGFKSPDPTPWPFEASFSSVPASDLTGCTYSTAPQGRENYPINCVTFDTARAYCKFVGGDLPTEAQWEYAAAAAGRTTETKYPWGDGTYPDCTLSVHGRAAGSSAGTHGATDCNSLGVGPQPLDTATAMGQDVTPLGLLNMGGSLSEWTLDTVSSYSDPCWAVAGPKDPSCVAAGSPHMARGSEWSGQQAALSDRISSMDLGVYDSTLGLRCVYPNGAP